MSKCEEAIIKSYEVYIQNSSNERLVGVLDFVTNPVGGKSTEDVHDVVILCHGLASTKENFFYPEFASQLKLSTYRFISLYFLLSLLFIYI